MPGVSCKLIGCRVVLCLRHSVLVLCLIMSGRRQTDRWSEGSLVSSHSPLQSRQQMSAISCGTEINDVSPLPFLSRLLSWLFFSWFFYSFPYSDLTSSLHSPLKHWSFLFFFFCFIPFHEFLFIFPLFFIFYPLRQTSYAQKPWRIRWTQCGTKRWCIMASQQPTWPPKPSGRCPALYFTLTSN